MHGINLLLYIETVAHFRMFHKTSALCFHRKTWYITPSNLRFCIRALHLYIKRAFNRSIIGWVINTFRKTKCDILLGNIFNNFGSKAFQYTERKEHTIFQTVHRNQMNWNVKLIPCGHDHNSKFQQKTGFALQLVVHSLRQVELSFKCYVRDLKLLFTNLKRNFLYV